MIFEIGKLYKTSNDLRGVVFYKRFESTKQYYERNTLLEAPFIFVSMWNLDFKEKILTSISKETGEYGEMYGFLLGNQIYYTYTGNFTEKKFKEITCG